MGDPTATPGKPGVGRLVIFSCRLSNSNPRVVRTKLVRRFLLTHPVYAIAKLDLQFPLYVTMLTQSSCLLVGKSLEYDHL
jgi:hypothetical protein